MRTLYDKGTSSSTICFTKATPTTICMDKTRRGILRSFRENKTEMLVTLDPVGQLRGERSSKRLLMLQSKIENPRSWRISSRRSTNVSCMCPKWVRKRREESKGGPWGYPGGAEGAFMLLSIGSRGSLSIGFSDGLPHIPQSPQAQSHRIFCSEKRQSRDSHLILVVQRPKETSELHAPHLSL